MYIPKPKNDYALVVWLLIKHKSQGVTMVTAMQYYFHKFQNRLGDVEKSANRKGNPRKPQLKILRLWIKKKNRFGHQMNFMNYKSLAALPYLVNLLKFLNQYGLTQPQQTKK